MNEFNNSGIILNKGQVRGEGCGAGHGRGAVEYFLGELHGFQGRTVGRSVVTNRV